jgi:hypothetical protein
VARIPECLILENWTDKLSRNVGSYEYALRNIPKEQTHHGPTHLHYVQYTFVEGDAFENVSRAKAGIYNSYYLHRYVFHYANGTK